MGEITGITWTDHTFNPWIGCTKVSPGCDHCYAETLVVNRMGGEWGPGAPRREGVNILDHIRDLIERTRTDLELSHA